MLNWCITKWDILYYKLVRYYKVMELYYKVGQVLETGANIVTNYGSLALLQNGARADTK